MISNEEVALPTALLVALVTAIATALLAYALATAMGVAGVVLAAIIGAVGVGIAVSAMYGVEIKRAMLVGGLFIAVHVGTSLLLQSMLR